MHMGAKIVKNERSLVTAQQTQPFNKNTLMQDVITSDDGPKWPQQKVTEK